MKLMRRPYSLFIFLPSFVRFASTAVMTREASERVKESTFWNSPRLRTEVASSSPSGGGLDRDVGC